MITNRDVICQLDEAFKVLSGPSHSIYKIAKVADILREIREELDGCKPCKPEPCKPCGPAPDCCDDDDCHEECDECDDDDCAAAEECGMCDPIAWLLEAMPPGTVIKIELPK